MNTTRELHAGDQLVIVDRADTDDGPIAHGKAALLESLSAAGATTRTVDHWTETDRETYLLVGTAESRPIARLLADVDAELVRPEGVVFQWRDTGHGTALVVAGTDDRGLMYALLELAERVDDRGLEALSAVEPTVEFPDNAVRGVDRFVETPVEDAWLYDDDFWTTTLDRLARSRFNRFVLITGYDTAFMSPPYPFVVDVPDYPEVRLTDELDYTREQHRERLRRIGELCHEHGLEFVFGIWQQRPWTDYQGSLVEGLPEGSELADYCAAGLRELLIQVPEIDGVQLRVNHESGVTAADDYATAEAFWLRLIDAVAEAETERDREIGLDLRAKGLTDDMIDYGLERGFDVTVPTKFWCESTGLPYHNSRMRRGELENLDDLNRSRRYSYADMLAEPRAHDVLYRLWATGTNRIFVWGDPDYARRFSQAAGFGDGVGFEVTTPLSLKGGFYGLREEGWPLFADPDLREYDWEDERYWAWYRLFGRLGYAADADPNVFEREFRDRFGTAANHVLRAYRTASKVLPLITAFNLTSHPALENWTELDTGGALFADHNYNDQFGETTYATAEPSDPGLFYAIDEYVADAIEGSLQGKYTPPQVAEWLAHFAAEARTAIDQVGSEVPRPETGEYAATELDVRMLADLADYHAHKIHAATALNRFQRTDDASELPEAYAAVLAMRQAWDALATCGEGTYADDMVFGMGPDAADYGNWSDRLAEIDADVAELARLLDEHATGVDPHDVDPASVPQPGAVGVGPLPAFELDVPVRHAAGADLAIDLVTSEITGAETVRLHYRRANQLEGAFREVEMDRTGRGYRTTIPGEYVTAEFDLLVYASVVDGDGRVAIVPGIYHPGSPMPYRVVETRAE